MYKAVIQNNAKINILLPGMGKVRHVFHTRLQGVRWQHHHHHHHHHHHRLTLTPPSSSTIAGCCRTGSKSSRALAGRPLLKAWHGKVVGAGAGQRAARLGPGMLLWARWASPSARLPGGLWLQCTRAGKASKLYSKARWARCRRASGWGKGACKAARLPRLHKARRRYAIITYTQYYYAFINNIIVR